MFDFLKHKRHTASAIIVAAGNGTRMKSEKSKQFIEVNERPLISYTLTAFQNSSLIDEIIIVTRESDILIMSDIAKEFGITKVTDIVKGGDTRTDSVKIGIMHSTCDYVAIHDGARPCIKPEQIDETITKAFETEAAALGCKVTDTLKRVDENGFITKTVDRSNLWQIQTPQVFRKDLINKAYAEGNTDGATDDCMLLENIGIKIAMVQGDRRNIKVTVREDTELVSSILTER